MCQLGPDGNAESRCPLIESCYQSCVTGYDPGRASRGQALLPRQHYYSLVSVLASLQPGSALLASGEGHTHTHTHTHARSTRAPCGHTHVRRHVKRTSVCCCQYSFLHCPCPHTGLKPVTLCSQTQVTTLLDNVPTV